MILNPRFCMHFFQILINPVSIVVTGSKAPKEPRHLMTIIYMRILGVAMRTMQLLLAAVLLYFSSTAVYAERVIYEISAVVDHIYDPDNALAQRLKLGDNFSSTYTFEANIPDTAASPLYGFYNQAGNTSNGFALYIKSLSPNAITTKDVDFHSINTWNGQSDFYYVESKLYAPIGNGLAITFIGLEVFDSTGLALSSDKLSSVPPLITHARDKNMLISGRAEGASKDFELRASITLITEKNTMARGDF